MFRDTCSRLIGAVLVIAALAGSAHALPFSSIVAFGDSLADTGNNARFFDEVLGAAGARTPTPIPSPTFVPELPYAADRYSNGPVWVEQFAGLLGLRADPSLAGGTNFAFGGARTGPAGSSFPFSLLDQASMFLAATGGIASPDALYIVQGGGNDARDALFSPAALGGDRGAMITAYAANIGALVGELAAAGADTLLLANTPDIGLIPATLTLGPAAAALASAIASEMNAALDAVLATLVLPPSFELQILDLFGLLNQLHADPGAFGLSDATSACAVDPACIAEPSSTFFWDAIHPTTAGHAVLAQRALALVTAASPSPVPEPATVALLFVAALAALGVRRPARRRM